MRDLSMFTTEIVTCGPSTVLAQTPRAPDIEGAWYVVRFEPTGVLSPQSGLEMALVAARIHPGSPDVHIMDGADEMERDIIENTIKMRATTHPTTPGKPPSEWYDRWSGQPMKG